MGTTSEKLTYLNTTKGLIKDSINLTNANILSTDTFRSYATKLKNGLVDIINNGIDTLYSNFPKVSGEGTEIALTSTYEAPIKLNAIKGDTQQNSYTGKNKCGIPNQTTSINEVSVTVSNGEITLNGTASTNGTLYFTPINTTILNNKVYINNIYVSGTVSTTNPPNFNIRNANTQAAIFSKNLSNENSYGASTFQSETEVIFGIYVRTGNTFNNYKFKPQVTIGTSEDFDYEPYVGGTPSPNPDYPQNVNVVTGIQSINVVGKNLFSSEIEQGVLDSSTGQPGSSTTRIRTKDYINVNPNTTYTLSIAESNMQIFIYNYKNNETYINRTPSNWANLSYTFTTGENVEKIKIIFQKVGSATIIPSEISNIQLEQRSTATTYEPYKSTTYTIDLGTIELCKIGNYQDTLQKSSGKNLFDKDSVANGALDGDGSIITSDYKTSNYIKVEPNTEYHKNYSGSARFKYYNNNKQPLSNIYNDIDNASAEQSFTIPSNAYYIRFSIEPSYLNTLIIEKGSSYTSYEPYGKVWYKKANIGKVVLDGSNDENWTSGETNISGYLRFNCTINNIPNIDASLVGNNLSDKFIAVSRGDTWLNHDGIANGQNFLQIYSDETKEMSVAEFRTWLSSNNVIAYYQLATPTYEIITDSSLINQLESIKSKNDVTNITISGNLPMIINASALEKE